ncbi:MAG: quinoprotein dehydrogenase-associated putative ABC transporter substrate-binding protein [Gemmatimonadales bacterium]
MPQLTFSRSIAAGSLAASLALLAPPAAAQDQPALRSHPPTAGVLRICADPDNMPASNQKGEGYENKIAELIAREWNAKLEYAWWPVRRGFFSRALNGRYCDVALTAPSGLDMAATTKPYYRAGYVVVYRKDSGLDLKSLEDPAWKKLRIGINLLNSDATNTPPAMALSRHGVVGNLVGFTTFYSVLDRPEDIVNAVVDKKVDASIVWGPLAGYFAQRASVPLVVQPLTQYDSIADLPFAFNMSMAVRRRDRELRDSLEKVIDQKHPEIEAILRQYAVPLLPVVAEEKKGEPEQRTEAAPTGDPSAPGAR